jgi:uncharacterized protein (TIGR02284 family)
MDLAGESQFTMNTVDEKVINTLNELIEICKDGSQGFQTAAHDVGTSQLQQFFLGCATERSEYIRELRAQVFALGGDTEKSGSVAGSLHRGWMSLKSALTSNEPAAVLVGCESGEDAAVGAYYDALEVVELDPETRSIISRQAHGIQASRNNIRALSHNVAA